MLPGKLQLLLINLLFTDWPVFFLKQMNIVLISFYKAEISIVWVFFFFPEVSIKKKFYSVAWHMSLLKSAYPSKGV